VGVNEFRAVGTAFDIRVKSDRGIELTVTEGRVQVTAPSSGEASRIFKPNANPLTPTQIVVDAGKEVSIDSAIQTVQRLQPAQMEAAMAWKRGMIIFDADPLEKVIREVSRYSTTKFVIVEEKTKRLPVSGYFKVGDVDGLIAVLHDNFSIDARRDGDVIILSAAK
jgi:transmembrane sensor